MKRTLAGLLILTLLLGAGLFGAALKVTPSADDRRVLAFVSTGSGIDWGLAVALTPLTYVHLVKPELKDKLDLALAQLPRLAGWAPQDKAWWTENVAAVAIGRMKGKPFYLFSAAGSAEELKTKLVSGKLAKKNADGTYTLVAPQDCATLGPVSVTVSGNVVALLPAAEKLVLPAEGPLLRLLTGSVNPQAFAESMPEQPAVQMLRMTGALEAMKVVRLSGEVSNAATAQLSVGIGFTDINKGKELLKLLQEQGPPELRELFKTNVTVTGQELALQLPAQQLQRLVDEQSGSGDQGPGERAVTAEALAKLEEDRELDKPVNYTDAPGPAEIFGDCEGSAPFTSADGKLSGAVVSWSRSRENPHGSFLTVMMNLCLNPGYVPLLESTSLVDVRILEPRTDAAVCGEELGADGIRVATKGSRSDGFQRQLVTFGISDDAVRSLKEIKGQVTTRLPTKVKKLAVPFTAPYTFDVPLGQGRLKITSEMDWRGPRITVTPEGDIPVIFDVRALNAKKVYLDSRYSFQNLLAGMLDDLLGLEEKKSASVSFVGNVAELEIVYAEATAPTTLPFTLPWSIPRADGIPLADPGSGVYTADGFAKLYSGANDALSFRKEIEDSEREKKMIPNAAQTSGPFLFHMYPPEVMFSNDIRIFVTGAYREASAGLPPYDVTITRAELSNGEAADAQPLAEKPQVDEFGREVVPWGHWKLSATKSNGGFGSYVLIFFDEHLKGLDEDAGIHPTYVEGKLSLKLPLSYAISDVLPLNILAPVDYAGSTFSFNDVTPTGFTVQVPASAADAGLAFFGVASDGQLLRLKTTAEQSLEAQRLWQLEAEAGELRGVRIVKYSAETKTFEFPFQFGKKKTVTPQPPTKKR